jgi:hypothetical protein
MRLAFALLSSFLFFACSSSSSGTAPIGPDGGAGCSAAIYGHCTFANGVDALGPVCIEFSGPFEDHSSCTFLDTLASHGTYATGACPRDGTYDESCALRAPTPDAGTCLGFETIWGKSSNQRFDAGIPGLPSCLR